MKIKNLVISSLFLVTAIACKEGKSYAKSTDISPTQDTVVAKKADQKDIFINKEFFSGDELVDVETFKTGKTDIDSVNYSIYKSRNSGKYIFSLEKFLKNDDVEKYRITDTVNLNSPDIAINVHTVGNKKLLSLKSDKKLLKEWSFNNKTVSAKSNEWVGNFSCRFLRMKEESGDPRAYGMINLNISKSNADFKLDSYVENVKKDLMVIEKKPDEIILAEKNNKNATFKITKNNSKYLLKSDFINTTVGENDTYELTKK
ncbi:hypothetical protein [Chryseobacterium wangxinyae]|uniref:hypothetical protein n=1 Tax=Chryseobacterium sp. CY353 TaxID=2997334 RepID=UPI00226E571C|nr:hypothetical protein [Chryseobacterium sp. CY353]MCY0967709.1 hypothetical protein [Chryseobacterium sp. CY353]